MFDNVFGLTIHTVYRFRCDAPGCDAVGEVAQERRLPQVHQAWTLPPGWRAVTVAGSHGGEYTACYCPKHRVLVSEDED